MLSSMFFASIFLISAGITATIPASTAAVPVRRTIAAASISGPFPSAPAANRPAINGVTTIAR